MAGRLVVVLVVALAVVGVSVWALSEKNPPAVAQQGTGSCPGAQTVNTTTGSGNKQSPVFDIAGSSFRLTANTTATSDPQLALLTALVYPEGNTGNPVGDFSVKNGGNDSSIVNAGPGRFYLDIAAANVNYTITVEDCTGGGGTPTRGAQGGTSQGKTNIPPPSPPSQPKASGPPSPPNPSPPSRPPGALMNAGGPTDGPVPTMPNGSCPKEFPDQRNGACYATS